MCIYCLHARPAFRNRAVVVSTSTEMAVDDAAPPADPSSGVSTLYFFLAGARLVCSITTVPVPCRGAIPNDLKQFANVFYVILLLGALHMYNSVYDSELYFMYDWHGLINRKLNYVAPWVGQEIVHGIVHKIVRVDSH